MEFKPEYQKKIDIPINSLVITLMLIYPLLFIWQGLDLTDTGYVLTNYQQIFNEPSSIESSFRIWLSDIIGGSWIYFFGNFGVIGYKFAAVLLVWATLYITYMTLRLYIKKGVLLFGLLLALMFINRTGYQFNYNSFTALFYVTGVYFIFEGLRCNKKHLIFVSAFILGLNIFIRLPNILGFFLISSIFFYGFINKTQVSVQLRQTFYFLSGYLISVVFALFVMYMFGHFEIYVSLLKETFLMINDPLSHHSKEFLVDVYMRHHQTMLSRIGTITLALICLSAVLTISAKCKSMLIQYGIIFAALFTLMFNYYAFFRDWINLLIMAVGIVYVILLLNVFNKENQNEYRLISFFALLVLLLTPLGSNIAIRNSIYGMYFCIPLTYSYFSSVKEIKKDIRLSGKSFYKFSLRISKEELKLIKVLVLILFLFFTNMSTYGFTYRDSDNRMKMLYDVRNPLVKGVLTTKERAMVLQELTDVLPGYVKAGDYLLAYEQVSLVYFLTKTKPYLYSAWPMLYNPSQFDRSLNRALTERPELPVIVRAKGNTEDPNWPNDNGLRKSPSFAAVRTIMNNFIKQKNYQKVWENSFFEILVPGNSAAMLKCHRF